ncbi:sodium:calcium antiporter [Pseudoxanthomonas taiwanensis]|uniref:Cation:H+ antiporter n=1 Tax=Pseudoxanthomonas taiwanensis J19 TaxID=935569 RepID=A0A562DKV6_9GAMM|nr:sodium:calcium antiporter [Pseudoxanthomonas taiwanensis]TWH10163.1 cation:H+ antiporter [Pseudoxanthomonas taiwanensis J19]
MVATLGGFALGLLLLALGGDSAVKGVSGLGQRLGLRPFVAGVLLLAFATSIPELAVNLRAVAIGQGHLALGNAVGSTLANLGLTLGLAALAAPLLLHARLLLPQLVLLVAAVLVLVLLGLDGYVGRIDGLVLVAAFIVALAHVLRRAAREAPEVQQGIAGYAATRTVPWLNLLRLAIAIPLLWFGARWVVSAGLDLGWAWGLTPLLAGLLPALPASFVRLELPALLVLAALAWPMLRGDRRLSRGEGGVLVAVFAAWIVLELALL